MDRVETLRKTKANLLPPQSSHIGCAASNLLIVTLGSFAKRARKSS